MSSGYDLACPHCGKSLMTRDADGNTHLLTRLTTFTRDGKAVGKCAQCKKRVPIPVRLAPTMKHVVNK